MNVVDSSAWVEYFVDGSNAGRFAPAIEDSGALIVPAIDKRGQTTVFARAVGEYG